MTHTIKHRVASAALALAVTAATLAAPAALPAGSHVATSATAYAAATFTDTSRHWAKDYIAQAVSYGFVNGYGDGTFKPDSPITRAEFTKMLNSALGNKGTAGITFWDVPSSEWYYTDVQKGVAAGYITGYSDTEFAPSSYITREQAAVMLARVVPAAGASATLKVFDDYTDVSDWATAGLQKMVAKGYIGAYNDGSLHPTDELTRAQAAKVISEIINNETIVSNNQTVYLSDVVLTDTIYANRISIGSEVADGTATFSNCTILGSLNVTGGGSDSDTGVNVLNTRVASADVHKSDSAVRVYAKGETTILSTTVSDIATLETGYLSGSGDYGQGFVDVVADRAADLSLIGDFQNVEIAGEKVDLSMSTGTLDDLTVDSAAYKTDVDVAADAEVSTASVYAADTVFTGKGKIIRLNAYADRISYETEPQQVTVGSGVVDQPYRSVDSERALTITTDPKDGATGVATGEDIVLKFSSPVHKTGSSRDTLSASEAQSLITIREGSASGGTVPFTASVSSDARTVTLELDDDLEPDENYYIRMAAGAMTDMYDNVNDELLVKFTTGKSSQKITFSPSAGATEVAMSAIPTITFNERIVRYSSGSTNLTSTYLQNSAVTVTKQGPNSVGTEKVDMNVTIDAAGKIITLTPNGALDEETTYYITINEKTLMYESSGDLVPETSMSFTTAANSLTDRKVTANSDGTVTVSFKAGQAGSVYGIIFEQDDLRTTRPSASTIKNANYLGYTALEGHHGLTAVSKNETASLTFSNLDPNINYYIYMYLAGSDGTEGSVFSMSAKTVQKEISLSTLTIGVPSNDSGDAAEMADTVKYYSLDPDTYEHYYYVGTEAETVYIKCTAKSDTSPVYNVTYVSPITQAYDKTEDSGHLYAVSVPAGTDTQAGAVNIVLSSTDSGYASRSYTIYLRRINPTISKVTLSGDSGKLTLDLTSATTKENAAELTLASGTTSLELTPTYKDSKYLTDENVSYIVYKLDTDGTSWIPWSTTTKATSSVTLESLGSGGTFRISATSSVSGSAGAAAETSDRYFKLVV